MNPMACVLAYSSSAPSSVINIYQIRYYNKHQPLLPQRFIITRKSTSQPWRRSLSIAKAMEQDSSSSGSRSFGGSEDAKDKSSDDNPDELASGSPKFTLSSIPTWVKVAIGAILLSAIPFYKKFSTIQNGIEKGAYKAVDFIEKTAEVVEKVSTVVGRKLPPGELRETVEKVHEVAIIVDKSSEGLKVVIEKIDAMTDEIDAVVLAQPLIPKGEKIQQTIQFDEKITITKKN